MTAACVALALAGTASAQEAAPSPGQALDRATFIAQMDAQFQRLDGDNNGMVVAAEIIASQQQAAQAEALRQNQRVFAQLDRNGDGMLDTAEFAALAKPSAASVDATPMMSQFDADGDGIITLVEYRIATQANFDRVDTDRDGLITDMEERAAGIQP
ncbi:EF-hand domain-containing protein [Erythrobacter litoralis]|uniref:EF-hand domain-containing protein n=1 Tax=Erythrobacter litoralis TaxID=39960 RepID=UPI001F3E8E92|nr:EF-hand domain-containing protein [Erythrobacter litoralis]